MRYRPASAIAAVCISVPALVIAGLVVAAADPVTPPRGYIGVAQDFSAATAKNGAPNRFYNLDRGLRLNSPVAGHHGTFWSNPTKRHCRSLRYSGSIRPAGKYRVGE